MAWKGLLGRGCTVHVADQDDCPVGFVAAGPSRDPEAPAGRGEIYALYVLPAAWGTGVGKALHNEALVHLQATGLAEATLWVLDGNLRARTFYARQGWAPDGTVKTEVVSTVPLLELRYRRALYA